MFNFTGKKYSPKYEKEVPKYSSNRCYLYLVVNNCYCNTSSQFLKNYKILRKSSWNNWWLTSGLLSTLACWLMIPHRRFADWRRIHRFDRRFVDTLNYWLMILGINWPGNQLRALNYTGSKIQRQTECWYEIMELAR